MTISPEIKDIIITSINEAIGTDTSCMKAFNVELNNQFKPFVTRILDMLDKEDASFEKLFEDITTYMGALARMNNVISDACTSIMSKEQFQVFESMVIAGMSMDMIEDAASALGFDITSSVKLMKPEELEKYLEENKNNVKYINPDGSIRDLENLSDLFKDVDDLVDNPEE